MRLKKGMLVKIKKEHVCKYINQTYTLKDISEAVYTVEYIRKDRYGTHRRGEMTTRIRNQKVYSSFRENMVYIADINTQKIREELLGTDTNGI